MKDLTTAQKRDAVLAAVWDGYIESNGVWQTVRDVQSRLENIGRCLPSQAVRRYLEHWTCGKSRLVRDQQYQTTYSRDYPGMELGTTRCYVYAPSRGELISRIKSTMQT